MTFRPMLWPTALGAIALAILISLGNWQMDRLAWKEGLLARIEAGLAGEPVRLPASDIWPDLDPQSFAYTPVRVSGTFDHANEVHAYIPSLDSEPGYHVITPLQLEDGGYVLVDRGFVPISRKNPESRAAGQVAGQVTFTGIAVAPEQGNSFTPDPDLAENIWYHRPVDRMAEVLALQPVFPLLVDAGPAQNPGGLPVGGQTRLQLKNPHLGYAFTWYGLAVTLVGVWLAFHISAGRITLR
jgi:surfeit locus 1 family protein